MKYKVEFEVNDQMYPEPQICPIGDIIRANILAALASLNLYPEAADTLTVVQKVVRDRK